MHRRTWEAKIKARMVVEGLPGQPVAALCHEHQLSHSQASQWRDQVLAQAAHAFAAQQHTRTEARLAQENARRKTRVGALTCERNNSAERWG